MDTKSFGWKRNLNYIISKLFLAIKENKEYKANFYSVLFLDIVITIVYFFFYKILGELIFGIVNWEFRDYMMFWIVIMVPSKTRFVFSSANLRNIILTGKLNTYLTKPVNSFVFSMFDITTGASVVSTSIMYLICFILVFVFNYEYKIYGLLILFFGIISYIAMINFALSFLFYAKSADYIFNIFHREVIFLNEKFTPKLFEKSFLSNFFYLLPSALYGFFVIEVFKGRFDLFMFYFPYFLLILLIMTIGTYLLWHYGLKKYEAFG